MNEASAISLATFSISATALSFVDDLFDDLEELDFELDFELFYPASLLFTVNYIPCA